MVVKYGADLHSSKHGSGFPVAETAKTSEEEQYVKSGWNLNNISNLQGSVLSYIDTNISGMKACLKGLPCDRKGLLNYHRTQRENQL